MPVFLFSDLGKSTLAANIGPTATSITLAPGDGAKFPAPAAGQQFGLMLNDVATRLVYEVVYCTARSGDVLTVVRAQEGSTANSWVIGDLCWNGPTSGQMASMVQTIHMTDGSIAPTFASTLIQGNETITGDGQIDGVTRFGTGGNFYVNPAYVSGPLLNFDAGQYLLFEPGTGFVLNTGGEFAIIAPSGVNTSAALHAGTVLSSGGNILSGADVDSVGNVNAGARLRASLGARGSGDPSAAAILSDFLDASSGGSGSYFFEELPDGQIIQAYTGNSVTGQDFINFPNAFPNYCSQVVVIEGAPSGSWLMLHPTLFGAQQLSTTRFALYTMQWNGSSWQFQGGITHRYIAVGG